jgi:hypothetical protein
MDEPGQIQEVEIVVPPGMETGVYANMATVSSQTPHDYTLDFIQLGPGGDPVAAVLVARIKFSPSFLMPLLQALAKHQSQFEDQLRRIQEGQEGQEGEEMS